MQNRRVNDDYFWNRLFQQSKSYSNRKCTKVGYIQALIFALIWCEKTMNVVCKVFFHLCCICYLSFTTKITKGNNQLKTILLLMCGCFFSKLTFITRKHSSRMRTDCRLTISRRRGEGGGLQADPPPSQGRPPPLPSQGRPPPYQSKHPPSQDRTPLWTHKHLWKHYLPPYFVCGREKMPFIM